MLSLTLVDNNQWIAEGLNHYFSEKPVQIKKIDIDSLNSALKNIAGCNVLISELTAYGRDVQFFTELLRKVKASSPATRIIVLTDLNEKAVVSYVMSVLPGVIFLAKTSSLDDICDAVVGHATTQSTRRTKQTLSPREFGLLRLLGQTSNLTDIAYSLRLSCKTISHHRQSIIRKLNCANNKELFNRLNRMGYQLEKI
ncbi:response regulator transcription factor [Candidatus Pantoea floridensis]|uniref:DNA-binding response regulator, NarL/FixJ family, contains REC and HTH domains n=1 Tax=Candidatus Pantoea floridensis TaxID=1938870 RepID=A0A286DML5_9GAMM|nr:LuxR C-terminal-related transcriptional regulator [Pantoea floridensis]PIF14708.1 DNA-binding NarL/FixJ family response regulator [Enterobacteriaceae bacterium JKS000233]SOD59734.1 DNA-binding response regulator, NarL/FixJ family, contains REC and HTH domains [Pantoea floridensis]